MAICYTNDSSEDDVEVLSEINTTPLVDVMLVLLIIFLITIPVINSSIPVHLPSHVSELRQTQAGTVVITIDSKGSTYWIDTKIDEGDAGKILENRLSRFFTNNPNIQVNIRGDSGAHYGAVAQVLHACQRVGITRVGFVTHIDG
jgi:biopolymer transport protein ExbD